MAILSLAIYGSRARGDYNESSDVDLFAITDEEKYKMVVEGINNLACYPESLAMQRARDGDLFILHICEESKEIYRSGFEMNDLKSAFRYKNNYNHEKICAAELAWFLIDLRSEFSNSLLVNKRVAWCVRTILIALAAEIKKPVFSRESLVKFSGNESVDNLIALKDSSVLNRIMFEELEEFLLKLNFFRPELSDISLSSYRRRFIKTENAMGLKTAMSLSSDLAAFGYS